MKLPMKKMLAPLVIVLILLFYYVGFSFLCLRTDALPLIPRLLGAVIPLLFGGVCLSVLIERIKEIRSGEEDDLSEY